MSMCGILYGAEANGLKQAEVTAVVNSVSITNPLYGVTKPAQIKDVVSGKTAVNTGAQSRAELMFDDKTLTRLGANTVFTFDEGTRNMNLQKGNMLLQVPKGAGGATIRTAAVTAAITGTTVMMEHQPGQRAKVIVLEGTLRLYLNNNLGESMLVKPGQMIFMNPNDKKLPEPVDVNLKKLVGSSGLVKGVGGNDGDGGGSGGAGSGGNLNMDIIESQVTVQQQALQTGNLAQTPLKVDGGEVKVDPTVMAPMLSPIIGLSDPVNNGAPILPPPVVSEAVDDVKYSHAPLITDSTLATIDSSTTIQTDPVISRNGISAPGGFYNLDAPNADPSPSQYLFGNTRVFDNVSQFNSTDNIHDNYRKVAAFKFGNDVSINGQPSINTSNKGATAVALVAAKDTAGNGHSITASGSTTLNMPVDLALITEDGNINFSNNSGSITMNGHDFFAYARGTNRNLTISCPIYAGNGDVNLNAELDVNLNASISGASHFEVNAGEDFFQNSGAIQAQHIEIKAGLMNTASSSTAAISNISLAGASSGWPSYIKIEAPHIDFNNTAALDFQYVNWSELVAGAGGITADYGITGFQYIDSDGDITVASGNLGSGSIITANGSSNISVANGYITSPDVTCNGSINARGLQVENLSGAAIVMLGTGGIQPHVLADPSTEHILYAKSIDVSTGTIYGFDQVANPGVDGYQLEVHVQDPISLSDLSTADINFRGGDSTLGTAGDGGTFKVFSDGNLTADRNIYAHPGLFSTGTRGAGGHVELQSGGVLTTSNTIYTGLNPSYLASGGGTISLESTATSGNGIMVQNSTQLRALTQLVPTSGALVQLTSTQGANIGIVGTSSQTIYLEATQTTPANLSKILLDTLNTSGSSGNVAISTADSAYKIQMLADMIRIRSGANLTLQNATLTASEIRLLAANVLTFNTGVSLLGPSGGGNTIYLSAPTITFNSQVTTAASGTSVYYYTSGTAPNASNFTGSVTLNPLASAPAYNP